MAGTPPHVLLIHGIPQRRGDPPEQLAAIRAVCASLGLTTESYRWATAKETVPIIRLLQDPDRSFLDTNAELFATAYRALLARLDVRQAGQKVIIIAYSAGGGFFYHWTISQASAHDLGRLAGVITVAAPHTVPSWFVFEDYPDRPIPVLGEHHSPPGMTVRKIRSAGVPIRVVAGGSDLTVPYSAAMFPPERGVEGVLIHLATHTDICAHETTLERVKTWLEELLPSGRALA